jgi:hypothetical protein
MNCHLQRLGSPYVYYLHSEVLHGSVYSLTYEILIAARYTLLLEVELN